MVKIISTDGPLGLGFGDPHRAVNVTCEPRQDWRAACAKNKFMLWPPKPLMTVPMTPGYGMALRET